MIVLLILGSTVEVILITQFLLPGIIRMIVLYSSIFYFTVAITYTFYNDLQKTFNKSQSLFFYFMDALLQSDGHTFFLKIFHML